MYIFVCAGKVIADEFVVTSASCDEVLDSSLSDDMVVACIGCPGFSDSLNMLVSSLDPKRASGWCVHVLSIGIVFSTLLKIKQSDSAQTSVQGSSAWSAFQRFAIAEESSQFSTPCKEIRTRSGCTRYLVMVSDIEAMSEDTNRHATCSVKRQNMKSSVHCDSVRCKKGKNKAIKNIKDTGDVCCHLRTLMAYITSTNPIQSILVDRNASTDDEGDDADDTDTDADGEADFHESTGDYYSRK